MARWFGLALLGMVGAVQAAPGVSGQAQHFLAKHWTAPTALQGEAPEVISAVERSLQPEACGECHQQQYQDWRSSWHSQSMGPGVAGQLVEMVESDPYSAKLCWQCHAPLIEQQDLIRQDSHWQPNPAFDPPLQQHGMSCAACHVRDHKRYGPTRRDEPDREGVIDDEGLPHNGFVAEKVFGESAFCKGCHQFNEGDYALNGTLIENTYNEWLASGYPEKGVQCQTCHMPERRHLWRGVHDVEMVKQGVTIHVALPDQRFKNGEVLAVPIRLTNSGVGHYFPTYLTPKVFVRAWLLDGDGVVLESTRQQAVIGREASLDMQQELYDNRIPPGETRLINYVQTLPATAQTLKVEIEVEPDHFYEKFYRAVLDDGGGGRGRAMLQQALANAEASSFKIYQQRFLLNR